MALVQCSRPSWMIPKEFRDRRSKDGWMLLRSVIETFFYLFVSRKPNQIINPSVVEGSTVDSSRQHHNSIKVGALKKRKRKERERERRFGIVKRTTRTIQHDPLETKQIITIQ